MAEEENFDTIAALVRHNIANAVGNDEPSNVAARTHIDEDRITEILHGAVPDGYEIMAIEAAYKRPIWPAAGDR